MQRVVEAACVLVSNCQRSAGICIIRIELARQFKIFDCGLDVAGFEEHLTKIIVVLRVVVF